jgi:hypothetical protein
MWEKATVGVRVPILPENCVGVLYVMARFSRPSKNSCFVSGHDFQRLQKNSRLQSGLFSWRDLSLSRRRVPHIWPDFGQMWEKATVGARVPILPENFRFKAIYLRVGVLYVLARFSRPSKNSCFVSGHDFSRAVKGKKSDGL